MLLKLAFDESLFVAHSRSWALVPEGLQSIGELAGWVRDDFGLPASGAPPLLMLDGFVLPTKLPVSVLKDGATLVVTGHGVLAPTVAEPSAAERKAAKKEEKKERRRHSEGAGGLRPMHPSQPSTVAAEALGGSAQRVLRRSADAPPKEASQDSGMLHGILYGRSQVLIHHIQTHSQTHQHHTPAGQSEATLESGMLYCIRNSSGRQAPHTDILTDIRTPHCQTTSLVASLVNPVGQVRILPG